MRIKILVLVGVARLDVFDLELRSEDGGFAVDFVSTGFQIRRG